ncbi:Yip1 family protein [Sphingomonas profundi]|uniref:Yip1 family protein n=1 Tax=Alterirhizorhabdus profundi TaxID=2681549 RepID=UPI0012E83833|nr:Yip1 family protein [Sphingomonas profundi]
MRNMDMGAPNGVVERAKAILLTPKTEWPVIAAEPATVGGLYRGYVMILAAIPAVCGALGGMMWGHSALGITYRPSIGASLAGAVVSYLLTLVGVYLLALVVDLLAPRFGGTRSRVQAFKLAAYSGTAAWLAGLFLLIPGLGWLSIVGLYGLYLLYLGLPFLMRAPPANAMAYTAVTVLAAFLLTFLVGAITSPLVSLLSGPALVADGGTVSGSLAVPGVGTVDVGKLEAASKSMEAAANGTAATAIPAEALQAMLPATVAGLPRTEVSSASAGNGPIGGAHAEGIYRAGEGSVTLGLSDIGAAGALAAFGAAFNVQSNKQSATGYEKVATIDGRMVSEEYDEAARRGKYSVLVANRFMVEAEGTGVQMAALKGAVEAIGYARLEALAK